MPALVILGLIAAAAGAAAKIKHGTQQGKEANTINPTYQPYQASESARMQLGAAQQLFGGRMAGAQAEENNIFANQAGTLNNVNQNATDSGQALQLGMLAQGQTNDALSGMQTKEQQNKYSLLGNLNEGYQAMVGEDTKTYQAMWDKYQMDQSRKDALKNAKWANISGALTGFGSSLISGGAGGGAGAVAGGATSGWGH